MITKEIKEEITVSTGVVVHLQVMKKGVDLPLIVME